MHRDPQRRYGSAEALIRDIDHYLKASRCRPGPIRSAIELASSSGETGAQSLRRRSYPRRWSRS
ncbi:MAG: hypothetical protein DMG58_05345 [Acidobacteria bacterium]|nr:MAG: hypothetical protein DMG58_05345 [Acidobacteriota bacterium]